MSSRFPKKCTCFTVGISLTVLAAAVMFVLNEDPSTGSRRDLSHLSVPASQGAFEQVNPTTCQTPGPSQSTLAPHQTASHSRAPWLDGSDTRSGSEYGTPTEDLYCAFRAIDSAESGIRNILQLDDPVDRIRQVLQLLRGDHPYFERSRVKKAGPDALRGVRRHILSRLNAAWTQEQVPRAWSAIDAQGLRTVCFDEILEILQGESIPEFQRIATKLLIKLHPHDRVSVLVGSVLRNGDPWVRLFALEELNPRTCSPDERRVVFSLVLDPDPRVGDVARLRLRDLCSVDRNAFRVAVERYDAEVDPRIRSQLLGCVCERPRSPEAVSRLRAVLNASDVCGSDEGSRCTAIELVGLHKIADEDLVRRVRMGLTDLSADVRLSAMRAIDTVGSQGDLDLLRQLARRESDPACREALAKAIGRLEARLSRGQ